MVSLTRQIPIAKEVTPGYSSLRSLVGDEQKLTSNQVYGIDQQELMDQMKKRTRKEK